MTTKPAHRDCRNYAPVDVSKGICHRTKDRVQADGECCGDFSRIPKCGSCQEFTPGAVEMGVCNASCNEPKFFAFPDMVAVTCESYRER